MKFKSNIELQAGLKDNNDTPGTPGQVLSSTGSAGGVEWIDQSALTDVQSNFVYFDVKNETGSTINKGKGVMAVGTDGNSGRILIDEMVADGSVEPKYFLGVLETTVANGGFARVISFGQLDQFDTRGQNGETWNDGDILWCDPDSAGDFTITEPDGPNVKIAAAIILNSSTNGKIQVKVQANEGIHDLHDTKITSQVDGDVLVWDNTTGVWFNDSTLNVDYTAGNVGIGTTTPSQKLTVSGNISATGTILGSNLSGTNTGDQDLSGYLTTTGKAADSELLDGINSTSFLRSDAADTASELITFQKGISQDGNAKFYTWRALDNTSSSSNQYYRIARITSTHSSRFAIELAGRSTSYSDSSIPAIGVVVGQLNNDNNYDIVFYNHNTGTSEVVAEVGQVDIGNTSTDIYIKVGTYAEISATGHISDGSITTYGGDSASTTAPTNYVAATELTVWNSGNDGSGSGLDADLLDGNHSSAFQPAGNYFTDGDTVLNMANNDGLVYNDTNNLMYIKADGTDYQIIDVRGGTMSGTLNMGSNVLTGNNFNITGVNQLTINDPGEGILFGGGSNNVTLYAIDDATDNKMNFSGASELQVNGSKVFHDAYHPNADTLTTARTISLTGDVTGSVSFNGSSNVSITATVNNDSHEHSYIKAGGDGPSTEDLNAVANSVAVGRLSYRGYNSSSTNKPPAVDNANGVITVGQHYGGYNAQVAFSSDGNMYWRDNPGSTNGSWRTLWDSGNDGSGSGLDADLLDGQHASAFQPAGTYNTIIGTDSDINTSGSTIIDNIYVTDGVITSMGTRSLTTSDIGATPLDHIRSLGAQAFTSTATTAGLISEMESDGAFDSYSSVFKTSWNYAGNFDLSDAGRFTETAGTSWITWTDNSSDSTRGNITALAIAPNTGGSAGKVFIYNDQGSSYSPGWREVWTSTSDGSGSGLDADLLDGNHASAFATASHAHTWSDISGETANSINGWGGLRHQTNDGYIDFGPANSSYAHIYTDRPSFYFNKQILLLGGSQINQNDIRSKIFYDSNNTTYYVDPDSTSVLNHGKFNSTLSFGLYTSGSRGVIFEGYSTHSVVRNDADRLDFYMGNSSGGVGTMMTLTKGGNVGIGTTSPDAQLHIYKGGLGTNTGVTDVLRIELNRSDHSTTPSGPAILFKDQDTNNNTNEARIKMMTVNDTDYGDNDEAASNLLFETTNNGVASDKMIITGRGNVGIGTTNPAAKLHVNGEARVYGSGSGFYVNMNANSSWGYFNTNAARIYLNKEIQVDTGLIGSYNEDLQLRTQGSTRMLISNTTGNVGIGTTNPSYKLEVSGNIAVSVDNRVIFDVDSDGFNYIKSDNANSEELTFYSVGPHHFKNGEDNSYENVVASNFVLSSDERLKENTYEIQNENINVNWKTFNFKNKPEEKRYGVVAQELEKDHPEFVNTDNQGFKSVKYIDLLIAKIAELEARLEKAGI